MSISHQRFTQEFKDELCREVITTSKPIKDVAHAYGVGPKTLRRWLIKYRQADGGAEQELTLTERARLKAVEREVQELRAERSVFKKSQRLLRPGAAVVSKYEFIYSQKNDPKNTNPIWKMCRWLEVSTSGFYHWRTRARSATALRRQGLTMRIKDFFKLSDGVYGDRRIHADLVAAQIVCSPELVRQIMRQKELISCQPRPFRITTQTDTTSASAIPDLINRSFIADAPGVKFVGDITYIHTWQGFIYLATVIDCYSKKVVGWSSADHMRSSMGRTGVCWDNSMAESFFAALKNERVYRTVYATKTQAKRGVISYIEGFYNSRRRHSALNYRIPNEVHCSYQTPSLVA